MSVDKLVDSTQLDADLTSVANAIRTKGGTSASLAFPAGFVSAIDAIPTGGGTTEAEPNDVNFYDYDGTCLHSYSKSDFLQLSEMPSGPSHSGLTFYAWNWSLTDAKAYVTKYGILEIGATYKTSDGSTRFYLDIFDNSVLTTAVRCKPSVSGGVSIDWGDGTSETVSGTSYVEVSHTYSAPGKYVVKVSVSNGTVSFSGGSNGYIIGGGLSNGKKRILSTIKRIEFGSNVLLETHIFNSFWSLDSVILPWDLASLGNYSFAGVYPVPCLIFPSGFATLGTSSNDIPVYKAVSFPKSLSSGIYQVKSMTVRHISMPDGCLVESNYSHAGIEKIIIPEGVTAVSQNAYRVAHNARYIEIGKDVTSIGATAFMEAPASEIHLRPTSPPSLSNTNAFANWLQDIAVFYVPYSADHSVLNAYKTATNWSTWSTRFQEEPQ